MSFSSIAVDVDGIGKSFGSVDALRDISFEVACGEVVALLGPDGAGKTTTVDILSTLTKPERGRARVAGYVVVADPAMVRRSIVITGRNVALDDVLTGYENIVMFGRLQGLNKFAATVRAWELIREAEALGDRIVVIDHGTIIAQGSAATVKLRIDETDCEVVQSIPNSRVEFTPESDA